MPTKRIIKIPKQICLGIIAAAIEVFPKECMGCICADKKDQLMGAFAYQLAHRKLVEVNSDSAQVFEKFFKEAGFKKFADFHSHTFQHFDELLPLEPSSTDLREIEIGGIEFIIEIRRTRKIKKFWKQDKDEIKIGWGRWRFAIAAFQRLKFFGKHKIPLYKKLKIRLAGLKKKCSTITGVKTKSAKKSSKSKRR